MFMQSTRAMLARFFPEPAFRPAFRALSDEHRPYHGQPFVLVRRPAQQTGAAMLDSGPWYTIQFPNGDQIDALPEEVEIG